jgi:hypothetical protein
MRARLCLAAVVMLSANARADQAVPPNRYPASFPFLRGADPVPPNIAWMSAETCDVVVLSYRTLSRDALADELRKQLTKQGWRFRRQKWAAKGTIELSARKAKRTVPVIVGARDKSGSTLTLYNCEP